MAKQGLLETIYDSYNAVEESVKRRSIEHVAEYIVQKVQEKLSQESPSDESTVDMIRTYCGHVRRVLLRRFRRERPEKLLEWERSIVRHEVLANAFPIEASNLDQEYGRKIANLKEK